MSDRGCERCGRHKPVQPLALEHVGGTWEVCSSCRTALLGYAAAYARGEVEKYVRVAREESREVHNT